MDLITFTEESLNGRLNFFVQCKQSRLPIHPQAKLFLKNYSVCYCVRCWNSNQTWNGFWITMRPIWLFVPLVKLILSVGKIIVTIYTFCQQWGNKRQLIDFFTDKKHKNWLQAVCFYFYECFILKFSGFIPFASFSYI